MDIQWFVHHLAAALVFGLVGIVLFVLALWLIVKISPFSLRKELEEDHNVAIGVLVGAVFLGIAVIVAAAIQG